MDEGILYKIDGIEIEVEEINYRGEPEITTENGNEYRLFQCHEDAEKEVRDYWNDMANSSPEELVEIIGYERIVYMLMMGESLDDWIEAQDVEAHIAHYDGVEYKFESEHEELSAYTLAYRTN